MTNFINNRLTLHVVFVLMLFLNPLALYAAVHQEAGNDHGKMHDTVGNHLHETPVEESIVEKNIPVSEGVGVEENPGGFIPLETEFNDESGKRIALKDFIDRPTILLPIFFYCPKTCSLLLANLATALNYVPFTPGRDFRVIALSFNEDETPEIAKRAKPNYMKILTGNFPESQWLFITGDKKSIRQVTDAIGFRFKKVNSQTFVHPNVLICLSGDGKIIRYIYGPSFLAGDIGMALSEAQKGTPGTSIKRIISFCFDYDPKTNRYVFSILRISSIVIFVSLAAFFFLFLRKKAKKEKTEK
ncbi:MAG: SCO family protein [Desulfobacterales bacterium]|nr:SCO family protein [Desulfobacteraceae bacterium]MBT4363256.1 SCO family protein [Desulfobacteraceae bacterium]MBT7696038.1 SCO family protein [Desulfobacterales bacterium]